MPNKHTPGPWKINAVCEVYSKDGIFIADCVSSGTGAYIEANARLIAAAPVGYELLKKTEWFIRRTNELGGDSWPMCLECGEYKKHGHAKDCKLATYFGQVEGKQDA